ncbi:MAG: glycosyltransferase family 39 protein [Sphaerobacter sp.]|nr:glycosyltransferase family 39 protein [Sphaerobacter sp.]
MAIIAAGLILRAWSMARANWMIDGDEATFGLMARHILQGERPIFLYGQPYMGSFQAYLGAIAFTLFGMSRVALKAITFPEFIAFALSVYLLARRVAAPRAALLATLFASLAPIYIVSTTARLWGPLLDAMTLGNLILLLAIDEAYPPSVVPPRRRWLRYLAMGVMAGFGFWLHGQIVVYIATAAILLFLRDKRVVLRPGLLVAALAGFAVGAAPVLEFARTHDYTTFHHLLGVGAQREHRDYLAIAAFFFRVNVPRVLGVANPWAPLPTWLQLPSVLAFAGIFILAVVRRRAGLLNGLRLSLHRGQPVDALLLFCGVMTVAFVGSAFGDLALRFPNFDATGRYAVPLASVIPIILATEIVHVEAKVRWAGWGLAALVVAVWLAGYATAPAEQVWQSAYWRHLPPSSTALVATLDELGVDAVWMNHWAGKPLMFDTQERIAAADYYDLEVGRGIDRLPNATARVRAAASPAYVFVTSDADLPIEDWLRQRGIAYDKRIVPGYVAIRPHQRVAPNDVVQFLDDDR